MMHKSSQNRLFLSLLILFLSMVSCVPERQFQDLKTKERACQDENTRLKSDNQLLNTSVTELNSRVTELTKNVEDLKKDTTEQGLSYRRLNDLYSELTKSYEKLIANNEKLLAGNSEETRKLLIQLNQTREDLQKKEDQMKKDSAALADRETRLNELKESLKGQEQRVLDLQAIIDKRDSSVNALRKVVSDALLGYQNNGLSVNTKNGKVYVSMEERLLFASGSTVIEKKGEEALRDLAKVLEKNKDIHVSVEGHTDNVPISGTLPSGARDNWELSVLRATSVVKIILKNTNIEPTRVTASGRGPYEPIDPSGSIEAKKKNRRTEIILAPKLDELYKALE